MYGFTTQLKVPFDTAVVKVTEALKPCMWDAGVLSASLRGASGGMQLYDPSRGLPG